MQNLEEKIDIMLQKQSEMQGNIINILTVQRDILKTQYEMQQDIKRLDKKIDDNYEKLDRKIDDNTIDTSEILQKICKRLDQNKIPKRKIAIL